MLEALAQRLQAEHGAMARGGEIIEYTVPRLRGQIAADTAGEAIERLVGIPIPKEAFLSARVNLAPHPDDIANYKTMNGMSEVPTDPYKDGAAFATGLMRLADNVEAKQKVLSVTIRIAIPPQGFMAIHGDGLMAGPRVGLGSKGRVYQETSPRHAENVTAHPASWLRKPPEPKRHPKSWLRGV